MRTLKLSLGPSGPMDVHMADFNRLRWISYALGANPQLRRQLERCDRPVMYDSVCLAAHAITPVAHAHVVLWDGLNSHMELLRERPGLQQRSDLQFLYVGAFAEVAQALPAGSRTLFPRQGAEAAHTTTTPWLFSTAVKAKTHGRRFKNWLADRARHAQLAQGGNLVFCGVVRPTPAVLTNMLTSPRLQSLREPASQLGATDWREPPARVQAQVQALYRACRALDASSAEDYCGIYSLLNLCSRMAVINQLHAAGRRLFVSEYGFQKNFDAYDTDAYGNNLFLDFGSSRGACHWYPRTMDMRATGKRFFTSRVIHEEQSLAGYLASHSEADFAAQLGAHAAAALRLPGCWP